MTQLVEPGYALDHVGQQLGPGTADALSQLLCDFLYRPGAVTQCPDRKGGPIERVCNIAVRDINRPLVTEPVLFGNAQSSRPARRPIRGTQARLQTRSELPSVKD